MATSIVTKYLGPTNFRGARIKATLHGNGESVTVPYRYDLSGVYVHEVAVEALLEKLNLPRSKWVYTSTQKGYVFIETE